MKSRDEIGIKVASEEFEQFMNDAIKYHISNLYLNNHDVQYIDKYANDITYIGSGIIMEFNNSIMYEFGTGFGVCDYHLKFSKPLKLPIAENYTSIKDLESHELSKLIGKNPCWIIPTTCHRETTVLTSLEFRNYDKTRFKIIGTHFETLIEKEMMHHYDGAWILTDEIKIEKSKLL